jgi:glycogen(starch) synthase
MRVSDNPSRITVLMTTDAVGGVWSYALDLSRALTARGVNIVLAVMGPAPQRAQLAEARSVEHLELHHQPFDLEWYQQVSPDELARSSKWLKMLAREYAVDLLHLNGYAQAADDWQIPVLVVAHSCVYSWWFAVHRCLPPKEYLGYRERTAAGLAAADAVVAPSSWMQHTLWSIYGPTAECQSCAARAVESQVVPNFTSTKARSTTKQKVIQASGRFWDAAKNLALLDEIAPKLDWPVYVAGAANSPEGHQRTASYVKTMGQLSHDEMADAMASAGIFAHPALYEPFGLAPLEAAVHGCALVLSDIPPLREIWQDAALFASPHDSAAWMEALNRLARCEKERNELADKARRNASRFAPEITCSCYINLYRSLISAHASTSLKTIGLHEHPHQTVLPLHRF